MPAMDLRTRIGDVAKALFGEPNKALSKDGELRFGSHGSLRVSTDGDHRGTWTDHESGNGGGVLDLIVHKLGGDHKSAAAWLRDNIEGGSSAANEAAKVVAVYRYADWAGDLVHEVVRLEPKSFRQRRPDGKGGYVWNMKGVPPTLYNLPRVHEAATKGELVFVVEGEKDADRLNALGLVATCNAGGAGKWRAEHVNQLAGARVVILPDNDEAGRDHGELVAGAMQGRAASVKVIELPLAGRKGDVSDWLDAGGGRDDLLRLVEAAPEWRPTFKARFPVVWFGQEDAGQPLRWLVRGLMVDGGLSVFFGAPKSSKTFAALDLALHVAHGRDWFGLRVREAGVVYVAGEGAGGVRQRMKAWAQERDGEPGAPFAMVPQSINLFDDPDEVDRLIADIEGMALPMGRPVGLVVLDTLSRMIGGGDEDKARDVNVVVKSAERIQRRTGAHVLLVHHSGKDRDRGMRGSNALLGACDAAIEVTKDADTGLCEAKVVAIKDGGEIGPFAYTLSQTAVGVDEDGGAVLSCVIDPAGARQGGTRASLTDAERRALAVLKELIRDSWDNRDTLGQSAFVPAQGLPGRPGQAVRVPFGTWRDKFRDSESGTFDARKKRAERATKALIDKGIVDAGYDMVWLSEAVE